MLGCKRPSLTNYLFGRVPIPYYHSSQLDARERRRFASTSFPFVLFTTQLIITGWVGSFSTTFTSAQIPVAAMEATKLGTSVNLLVQRTGRLKTKADNTHTHSLTQSLCVKEQLSGALLSPSLFDVGPSSQEFCLVSADSRRRGFNSAVNEGNNNKYVTPNFQKCLCPSAFLKELRS